MSAERYNQLGIGDCGHVVHTWPQIHSRKGIKVLCDDCLKEQLDMDPDEAGWVFLRRDTIAPKPKKPRKAASPKPKKPLSPMEALLKQEGLW